MPDVLPYIQKWAAGTTAAKATLEVTENIAYGSHKDETLDFYPAGVSLAPVLIFIHGGAWRALGKDQSGYMAPQFVAAGVSVAVLNFGAAPAASLDDLVAQVRRAVGFIRTNAATYGGDPARLFLAGHSSGAHLAAMAMTDNAAPLDVIKGAVFVSGAYDLEPVRLSARNEYLKLDEASARRNSPLHHVRTGSPPALFAWGGRELDEFQRASPVFAEVWEARGAPVERLFMDDNNHFDMADSFAEPAGPLARAMLRMMKVG